MLSLPTELAVKLRERNPATAKEAAKWAYDYDLAHNGNEATASNKSRSRRSWRLG